MVAETRLEELKLEELKEEYERKDEMGIPMSVRKQYLKEMDNLRKKLKKKAHQKKLGRILLEKKLISDKDLREALTDQTKSNEDKLVGEVLLGKGLITRDQLEEAIKKQVSLTDGGSPN